MACLKDTQKETYSDMKVTLFRRHLGRYDHQWGLLE
jgi:hypothetical protein